MIELVQVQPKKSTTYYALCDKILKVVRFFLVQFFFALNGGNGIVTPHCNDDLNKINEHDEPMINSCKWMVWLCKITVFKMISLAPFLRASTIQAKNSAKFGQIGCAC